MKTSGFIALLLLFAHLQPAVGLPQTLHATIRGQVADISGSYCPNAQVAVINEETGETRQTISGADGAFTLPVLPPGSYRLEAELAGFQKRKFLQKSGR